MACKPKVYVKSADMPALSEVEGNVRPRRAAV
jgi:hypothetical protein